MPGREYKTDPALVQWYSPNGKRIVAEEYRERTLHAIVGFSQTRYAVREEDADGNIVADTEECVSTGNFMDEAGGRWKLQQCHPEPVKPREVGCGFCDMFRNVLVPVTKAFRFTCAKCGAERFNP